MNVEPNCKRYHVEQKVLIQPDTTSHLDKGIMVAFASHIGATDQF